MLFFKNIFLFIYLNLSICVTVSYSYNICAKWYIYILYLLCIQGIFKQFENGNNYTNIMTDKER